MFTDASLVAIIDYDNFNICGMLRFIHKFTIIIVISEISLFNCCRICKGGILSLVATETVGGRITGLRGVRGMTQLELAEKLCISTSALRNIEYNIAAPRLSTLEKLSDVFNTSIDYIVRGVDVDGANAKLNAFRESGLNDAAFKSLAEEIERGKEFGGLNEYIATLNALVSGGLLNLMWALNRLNNELSDVDKQVMQIKKEMPVSDTGNGVKNMHPEGTLHTLLRRREFLEWEYMKNVENVFKKLILQGDNKQWHE